MKRYLIILTFLSCFIIVDGQKDLGTVYFRNPRYLVSFDKIIYPGYNIVIDSFTVREYLLDSLISKKNFGKGSREDNGYKYHFENWILEAPINVNEKFEIIEGTYSLRNEAEGFSLNEFKTGAITKIKKVRGTYFEDLPFESNEILMDYRSRIPYMQFEVNDTDANGDIVGWSLYGYLRGSASETFKEWVARMLTLGDTSQNLQAIDFQGLGRTLASTIDSIEFAEHWEAAEPLGIIYRFGPGYYLKQMRENIKLGKEILVDDLELSRWLNTETNTETSSLYFENEHTLSADEIVDYNGNVYKTVIIGKKKWMAENLRASNFINGIPIPKLNEAQWNNTASSGIIEENINGNYYNFFTFLDDKNVCPVGYHTPNEDDIYQLYETITPKGYSINKNYPSTITFLYEKSQEYINPFGFSLNENLVSIPRVDSKYNTNSNGMFITYIDVDGYPQVWHGNNHNRIKDRIDEIKGITSLFNIKDIGIIQEGKQGEKTVLSENSKKLSTHIRCVSDLQEKKIINKKLKQ